MLRPGAAAGPGFLRQPGAGALRLPRARAHLRRHPHAGEQFINLGKMMDMIKKGVDANEALEKAKGSYGRFAEAAKYIDPRKE